MVNRTPPKSRDRLFETNSGLQGKALAILVTPRHSLENPSQGQGNLVENVNDWHPGFIQYSELSVSLQ